MPKILAICHKKDNLVHISSLLKNLVPECSWITAQSGAEGIENAKTEAPDTILLDTKIPEMNGLEVWKKLKSDEDTKNIPVIILAEGRAEPESGNEWPQIGTDAFLVKPIDEGELLAQVNASLRIKRAADHLCHERDLLKGLVHEKMKALRQSEERLNIFMDSSIDGFILFDSNLNVVEINKPALKICSLKKKEETIGKNALEISPDLRKNGRYGILKAVIRTGETFSIDNLIIHSSLGDLHISLRAFKVGDGLGIIMTDITERLQAEEQKRELEIMLQQAQKIEAIGTLAGGIAHDFNNILTAIIGYTQIAMTDIQAGTRVYNNLQEVLKAGDRARELVKHMLAFSHQNEQGKKPLKISLLVKEAFKMLRALLPSTIDIRQNIQADSGEVLADPAQIHQLLMNICTNAAQAMNEKGGVLEVSLENVDLDSNISAQHSDLNPGPYVRLTIADTGHGISTDLMRRIFDPYFTTKEKVDGTGLGLAVVHGIVKGHGGGINVYSEPGEGTTIDIFLPRIVRELTPEKKVSTSLPRGEERILFVDDEQALVRLGKQMLERLGYEVIAKTSSIEALEAFSVEAQKFDLVFTDLTMPNMTGVELAEKVLAIRPDIPIILCSGFGETTSKEKAKATGIRKFVMKPIVINEIAEIVREVLDQNEK